MDKEWNLCVIRHMGTTQYMSTDTNYEAKMYKPHWASHLVIKACKLSQNFEHVYAKDFLNTKECP